MHGINAIYINNKNTAELEKMWASILPVHVLFLMEHMTKSTRRVGWCILSQKGPIKKIPGSLDFPLLKGKQSIKHNECMVLICKYKDFVRLEMENWVPLLRNCLHNRLKYMAEFERDNNNNHVY